MKKLKQIYKSRVEVFNSYFGGENWKNWKFQIETHESEFDYTFWFMLNLGKLLTLEFRVYL